MGKKNIAVLLVGLVLASVHPPRRNSSQKSPGSARCAKECPFAYHSGSEGKSIRLEYRYSGGMEDRLPGLVAEFVQLKVDVLVVVPIQAIVMVTTRDPVCDWG
jgi:hypothetical protein